MVRIDKDGVPLQAALRSALDAPDARGLEDRDRGLATECVYGTCRRRLWLDRVLAERIPRGLPSDVEVRNALRLGAFQLLLLDRVPAFAAVSTTIDLVRKVRGERVAGFVNGVLRSLERDPPSRLHADRWAHPEWLVSRWATEPGVDLAARLAANLAEPPVSLRLHPSVRSAALPGLGPTAQPAVFVVQEGLSSHTVRDWVRQGRALPQDPASARVVEWVEARPGHRVLELCAGRGVKTSQLAETLGPSDLLVAIDVSAAKLRDALRLVARWAPTVHVRALAADASQPLPLAPHVRFDRILVDAPCTGLGVLRRRPEILWRRTAGDIGVLAALQRALLTEAARWLAPDGVIIYAVCTTTPEETTQVLDHARNALGLTIERAFDTTPERDGQDGFFAARLTRRAP